MESHHTLLLVAIPVLIVGWVLIILYNGLIGGPLSKLPGPFVSRWTNWILKYHVVFGTRLHYIHDLHKQYGPVVRISPTEASIADLAATKEIHAFSGGFLKSPWYQVFTQHETTSMFAMNDPKQHSARRRLLGNELSESMLRQHGHEKLVIEKASFTVDRMAEEFAANGHVDILKWWTFMATDIIGELSFGESFKMLESGQVNAYIRDIQKNAFFATMRYELGMPFRLLAKLPIAAVRDIAQSRDRIISYARASVERYKNLPEPPSTLFSKLYKSGEAGTLTDAEIRTEARSYIVAGSDTTSTTLTYLVWCVSQQTDVQQDLVAEVSKLPEDFTYEDVKELPILNNVITETLRMYGAAPGSLPRIVPPGGRNLAGYFFPEGTTASTQAFTLQRNEHLFPDPESFQPSRWENPTHDMKTAMLPFGGGSRACIGINLAYMELRIAVAMLYRRFPNVKISDKAGASDMEIQNFFLISPKARRCLMTL